MSKIACNILVIIFLGRFPTRSLVFLRLNCAWLSTPLDCTGQRKITKMAENKMAGASPCNLKMTSFTEIVRVADRLKFLRTPYFELNAGSKETKVLLRSDAM